MGTEPASPGETAAFLSNCWLPTLRPLGWNVRQQGEADVSQVRGGEFGAGMWGRRVGAWLLGLLLLLVVAVPGSQTLEPSATELGDTKEKVLQTDASEARGVVQDGSLI